MEPVQSRASRAAHASHAHHAAQHARWLVAAAVLGVLGVVLLLPDAAHGDGSLVRVDRARIVPGTVTIQAGDTVTFEVDQDESLVDAMQPFTLVSQDGAFRSPALAPGDVWRLTLTETGLYRYAIEQRPEVEGVIVVE